MASPATLALFREALKKMVTLVVANTEGTITV